MISLAGKKAFITGCASGIGAATARLLAEAGACVIATDINQEGVAATVAAIKAAGGQGEAHALDVCDPDAITALAEAVTASHGAMDAIVNVAGWDRGQPFMENTPDFIEHIVQLNYLGQVRVCKAFLPPMIEAGQGTIVNVASDAGRRGQHGRNRLCGRQGRRDRVFQVSCPRNGPERHHREQRRAGPDRNCVAGGYAGTSAGKPETRHPHAPLGASGGYRQRQSCSSVPTARAISPARCLAFPAA